MKWAILLMGVLSLVLGYALNIPDLLMLSVILYAAAVILDRSDDLEESMKEKEERIMRRIKDLEDRLINKP